ncbi:MAG TPA: 5'-3' exonuclease H3TH domain-containing protein [Thermoanaerobaculia bacterium]|jgi:5'-3' exonuclease|nr:5'-3' exonuclease H3TH domain-containing protein [Thermoanaerobaculia bacterium]
MSAGQTVYLVDASPYIFRAYFSLPDSLRDPAGSPVQAVYGFASFLLKLIADERPTHLAVAFDRSLTTSFRNDLYPAYKAQRALPPPELEAQLAACEEMAAALGAATFVDAVYEADDLIAALCERLEDEVVDIVVVTADKDLAQLVDPRTSLYDFGKGARLTAAEVKEKFGVRPDQVADLLGLAGDAVDNIPGVPGIGKKTAADLLARFGHLEELYERLEEVRQTPGIRGGKSLYVKLKAARELALLSKRLATVARDAPLPAGMAGNVGLADLEYRGADRAAVEALCLRLGFKSLPKRIERWR